MYVLYIYPYILKKTHSSGLIPPAVPCLPMWFHAIKYEVNNCTLFISAFKGNQRYILYVQLLLDAAGSSK